jgi:hypothetical protein
MAEGERFRSNATQSTDRLIRSLLTSSDHPLSPDEALPQLQQAVRDLLRAARELALE